MARRIAFANQKGGVGKTTMAVQTAFWLAKKKGKKVLVIDMDAQGNCTHCLLSYQLEGNPDGEISITGTRSHQMLLADIDPKTKENIVTETGEFRPYLETLRPMHTKHGIDLIGSPNNDKDGYEAEAVDLRQAALPAQLLAQIESNYDYVIIDCPPSLGRKLVASLIMAEFVVCPIKVSGFAFIGVEGLFGTILDIQSSANPEIKIVGAIVNEFDGSGSNKRALAKVREGVEGMLFDSMLTHRSTVDTAMLDGKPIWEVVINHQPRLTQPATNEFKKVMEELLKRIDDIEKKPRRLYWSNIEE